MAKKNKGGRPPGVPFEIAGEMYAAWTTVKGPGASYSTLAKAYGVTPAVVRGAIKRITRHVAERDARK